MSGKEDFYKKISMSLAMEAADLTPEEEKALTAAFNIVLDRKLTYLGDGPIGATYGLKAFEDAKLLRAKFSKK
jgi:hypothetical protein